MKEADLENLGKEEYYIVSPHIKDTYAEGTCLLRNGETVKGLRTKHKDIVVAWVNHDMDTYLGIGVFHG